MTGNNRKVKDGITQIIIYIASALTLFVLVAIIGFVLYKGIPGINFNFLTRMWDDETTIVDVERDAGLENENEGSGNYVEALGITLALEDEKVVITDIDSASPVRNALNLKQNKYGLKEQDIIEKAGDRNFREITIEEAKDIMNTGDEPIQLKVRRPGGGIIPMLVSTVYIIVLTLLIAAPIGIGAAIYLNEYAKPGKILTLIRFAIQNLAGIPSIIYGLFGMLVFVQLAGMQYSILAGALTLSIMLLPTIISTTEETLKEVPKSYKEGSYGLGATKLQTLSKIILPSALPGILVAIILSIGRIVGESAALIWTAGTVSQIPTSLIGSEAAAATLTTKMYWLIKEASDLEAATSIAAVLIILVIILNLFSKYITKRFLGKKNPGHS